jgi:hypothetical protein
VLEYEQYSICCVDVWRFTRTGNVVVLKLKKQRRKLGIRSKLGGKRTRRNSVYQDLECSACLGGDEYSGGWLQLNL